MEQKVDEGIVRKIQRLFEIASRAKGNDGTSNENEAAAAMGKAQELLAKYNLDLADVNDAQVKGGVYKEEKRDHVKVNRSAAYKWQVDLVQTIAEANFCWYWTTTVYEEYNTRQGPKTRKLKRHKILGSQGNTTVVIMMVDYLLETIENVLPYPNTERLSNSAISWRKGCAERLQDRIKQKAADMKTPDYAKQGEEGYAMAIQLVDLEKKEMARNYDAHWGEGAWARKLAAEAAYAADAEKRKAQWALEDVIAARKTALALANETPAQRARREKAEKAEAEKAERYWARESARYHREAQRERNNLDVGAYRQGQQVGASINLDSQLKAGSKKGDLA